MSSLGDMGIMYISSYTLDQGRIVRVLAGRRVYNPPFPLQSLEISPLADTNLSSFIWSVADLLRGDYKQSEYGRVILPFTVLRRLDCVLEPTKAAVLAEKARREKDKVNPEPFLLRKSKVPFLNTSALDMKKLMG